MQVEGFGVIVSRDTETDPDLSYLGTYESKEPKRPYWDRALERVVSEYAELGDDELEKVERWIDENRGARRYIKPGDSSDPEYIAQDVARLEAYEDMDWCMVCVSAEVFLCGVKLGSWHHYGIESDAAESDFQEAEQEVIAEAVAVAKAKLVELAFAAEGLVK